MANKNRRIAMYTCEGCGSAITATPGDPLVWTSLGKHCATCNKANASKLSKHDEHAKRIDEASQSRGEAARARWNAMTPEQRAERVAKLKAGRERSKEVTRA